MIQLSNRSLPDIFTPGNAHLVIFFTSQILLDKLGIRMLLTIGTEEFLAGGWDVALKASLCNEGWSNFLGIQQQTRLAHNGG